MATVASWNYFNSHVQSGLLEGRFLTAAYTLLAAGPPFLAAVGNGGLSGGVLAADIAWPIGLVQGFNIGNSSNVAKFFEMGSERCYYIRGRTQGQMSFQRVQYHGPSLLRALYAYLQLDPVKNPALYQNSANAVLNTSGNANSKRTYEVLPGYKNMWLELASDVFSQPIGLLIQQKDSNKDTVGAFYAEYCNVGNHSWGGDAGNTVLSESASLMHERLVPIDVDSVPLVRNSDDISGIIGGNTPVGVAT